jgi:hypothetical protein
MVYQCLSGSRRAKQRYDASAGSASAIRRRRRLYCGSITGWRPRSNKEMIQAHIARMLGEFMAKQKAETASLNETLDEDVQRQLAEARAANATLTLSLTDR